jgi:hypothetical protein
MKNLCKIIIIVLFTLLSFSCFASPISGSKAAEYNRQQIHAIKIIKALKTVVNSPELSEENRIKVEKAYNSFLARYQDISDDNITINGNEIAFENCSKRLDNLIADMKQFII